MDARAGDDVLVTGIETRVCASMCELGLCVCVCFDVWNTQIIALIRKGRVAEDVVDCYVCYKA